MFHVFSGMENTLNTGASVKGIFHAGKNMKQKIVIEIPPYYIDILPTLGILIQPLETKISHLNDLLVSFGRFTHFVRRNHRFLKRKPIKVKAFPHNLFKYRIPPAIYASCNGLIQGPSS
jgi:hypothetical protein